MASVFQTTSDLFTDIRTIAQKDTTTLPDSVLLKSVNKYFLQYVREIASLNEGLYAEISTTDLELDQMEYVLPTDNTSSTYGGGLIKITRVEVSYDGGSNWYLAQPITLPEITVATASQTLINRQYIRQQPQYWFYDRSIWLAPVPDSSDNTTNGNAGLRIFWVKRPIEIAATSDIPDMPKDFLGILEEGILYDVFRMFNRTNDARDALNNWYTGLARVKDFETALDADREFRLQARPKSYK